MNSSHKIIVGIDPGVITGLSVWDKQNRSFLLITSGSIIKIQNYIREQLPKEGLFVRVEDARQRKWFGKMDVEQTKYGAAVREGAGSIKRDCQIWEEFLDTHGIAYELVAPKNNKTKLDAKLFGNYTGWKERTNEHMRDSAMLVYGF